MGLIAWQLSASKEHQMASSSAEQRGQDLPQAPHIRASSAAAVGEDQATSNCQVGNRSIRPRCRRVRNSRATSHGSAAPDGSGTGVWFVHAGPRHARRDTSGVRWWVLTSVRTYRLIGGQAMAAVRRVKASSGEMGSLDSARAGSGIASLGDRVQHPRVPRRPSRPVRNRHPMRRPPLRGKRP